jgi:hypothetical protein
VDVLQRLASSSAPFAAVADPAGRIIGILTPDRILAASRLPSMPDDDTPSTILQRAG